MKKRKLSDRQRMHVRNRQGMDTGHEQQVGHVLRGGFGSGSF